MKTSIKMALLAAAALASTPAMAGLNLFQQFTGLYGLSTDGGGSTGGTYTVSAFVPTGATVVGAWLYQTNYNFGNVPGPYGITLDGNAVTFGAPVVNNTACCGLFSARANVTGLVAPTINGGPGGTYNFTIGEALSSGSSATDGTALVVVYQDPSLTSVSTIAILDGFSAVEGDSFTFNSAEALDPSVAGFFAELRLGIGFSANNQSSTVDVNGTRISTNAGNNDDGALANGALITVGGNDDPFSPFLPAYSGANRDSERYNLVPYIDLGDTSIVVRTANASRDDNIFLAAFVVNAEGRVVGPVIPEPATWALMIAGFGLVGAAARRRRGVAHAA